MKGVSSPISWGFGWCAINLAVQGSDHLPPPHYSDVLSLVLLLFAVLQLEPLSSSLFLFIIPFFHSEMAPLLYFQSDGVFLILVSMHKGIRIGGSKKYASTLTPNMEAILSANVLVRSLASLVFLCFPADILFWDNFSPEPLPPEPFLSLYFLLFSSLSLILPPFFARLLYYPPPPPPIQIQSIIRGGKHYYHTPLHVLCVFHTLPSLC